MPSSTAQNSSVSPTRTRILLSGLPPPPGAVAFASGTTNSAADTAAAARLFLLAPLAPPLPRPLCPRAQPIPACRHGLLAQSPRSSRPPPCPAHGVRDWPILMRCSHTGFPGWATASPTWPQLIGSSWTPPARNRSGIPGLGSHRRLQVPQCTSWALGKRSPPCGVL